MNTPYVTRKRHMTVRLEKEMLLACVFMFGMIHAFLSEISNIFGNFYPSMFVMGFLMVLSLTAWFLAFFRKPLHIVAIMLLAAVTLTVSELTTPGVLDILFNFGSGTISEIGQSNFVVLFGMCLPTFILCFCEIDVNRLFKYLYPFSVASTILFVIVMLLNIFGISEKLNYMNMAYSAIPGIFVQFFDAKTNHRKLSKFLWITGGIGIALGGSRGALLTVFIMLFAWLLVNFEGLTSQKTFAWIFVGAIAIGVIVNLNTIALFLDSILDRFGYSSRLLSKFLGTSADGGFFIYSDRSEIQNQIIDGFGFLGHGVFSDRLLNNISYPHNMILEIIYQYGYSLGSLILLGIFGLIVKTYRIVKHSEEKFYIFCWVAFVSTVLGKMMFSSSYLIDRPFWFFFGLFILSLKQGNLSQRRLDKKA